jgi:hypothetical protein
MLVPGVTAVVNLFESGMATVFVEDVLTSALMVEAMRPAFVLEIDVLVASVPGAVVGVVVLVVVCNAAEATSPSRVRAVARRFVEIDAEVAEADVEGLITTTSRCVNRVALDVELTAAVTTSEITPPEIVVRTVSVTTWAEPEVAKTTAVVKETVAFAALDVTAEFEVVEPPEMKIMAPGRGSTGVIMVMELSILVKVA